MRIYLNKAGEGGDAGGEGKDPDLVVVGDGAEGGVPGAAVEQQARTEGGGDREEDDHRDQRSGDTDLEDEARLGRGGDDGGDGGDGRGRTRETRAEKNERRRRARDRDRTELRYLRARNEQLERSASDAASRLDKLERHDDEERLSRIKNAIRNADATIVKLTAAGEEAQALEATTIKNNLQDQLEREQRRMTAERGAPRREEGDGGRQPAERREERGGGDEGGLSATAKRNALAWQARNSWFKPDDPGTDERVVHALDAAILAEGEFAPEDPEYYRELDRRIAEYMPHRARRANGGDRGGDDDERGGGEERRGEGRRDERGDRDRDDRNGGERPRRDAPRFRVGGRDRALKPNEVYLSKERREALEEMGAMDDPVLMKKYLKAFKSYDEQAARRKE